MVYHIKFWDCNYISSIKKNYIKITSVQIFQTANSSIDEFIATIYLGVALLASNILTVLLAHKVKYGLCTLYTVQIAVYIRSTTQLEIYLQF